MGKIDAKGVRDMAWQDLAHGQYWTYLGGKLVASMITSLVLVPPVIVLLAGGMGVALATGVVPYQADADCTPGVIVLLLYGLFASLILMVPLTYGIGFLMWSEARMALSVVECRNRFEYCFSGWGHGWKMGWTVMIKWTYLSLWWLLIVPGVVKTFSYAMTHYVQVDHPDWNADRCIDESRRLMEGNRWRLFCLGFSFIGWYLLIFCMAMVPMGALGQWFLQPYPAAAFACFYRLIQQEKGSVL